MQKVYEFLKGETYYLATVEENQPRVRPFGTIDLFENKLYIQTGKKKPVSRQMHENGKIEICCFKNGTWLRIEAIAIEDPRTEAQAHMLDAYPQLQHMYQVGDGNTEVFYLKEVKATFYSFTSAPEIHEF